MHLLADMGKDRSVNRFAAILVAAAALTLILSPSVRKASLRRVFQRDLPLTPHDFEPKYAIGGRYVAREQFDQHTERTAA